MLLVETAGERLLYTGDFKLGPSATAAPAAPPRADVLVMESTFGDPAYRLPPRDETIAQLVEIVTRALENGGTPVIHAYVLGKAQEVTKILTSRGFAVAQHRLVHEISQVYVACGCDLGPVSLLDGPPLPGVVVVAPPRWQKGAALPRLTRPVSIAVTGWANNPRWRLRQGIDYALPLSDHADYDELIECIERVQPRVIYCTHGPEEFALHLRKRGHNAQPLDACRSGQPVGR
jgi:Cft2 family RNA processing exonuclease